MTTLRDELREALADKEHAGWARWMDYLFSKCETGTGDVVIPADLVRRWLRQVATSYDCLTEQEKESDRKEVDEILPVIGAIVGEWLADRYGNRSAEDLVRLWHEDMADGG